jgi:hypothetical protein
MSEMCMLCIYVFLGACPAPNAGLGCVHLAKRQAMYITQRPCAAQVEKKNPNPISNNAASVQLLPSARGISELPPNDAFSRRNCWGRQAGRYLSPARSIDVEASWFMIPPPSHKLFVRPPPFFVPVGSLSVQFLISQSV